MTYASSRQPRTLLLATDSKHSILAELAGGRANSVAYCVYGHQSAEHAVTTGVGFNGELREGQTGWYFLGNGYRVYNPRLMRFHSADSWSPFRAGGLNAYVYCGGDPVMGSDPTGHFHPFKWPQNIRRFFTAPPPYRAVDSQPSLSPLHIERGAPPLYSEQVSPPPYSAQVSPPPYWESGPPSPRQDRAINFSERTPPSLSPAGSSSGQALTDRSRTGPIVNRSNKPPATSTFQVVTGRTGDQRVILNLGSPSRPTARVLPNGVVIGRDGVERASLASIQQQMRQN